MKFIRDNSLSIAFFVLFIISFAGQLLTGYSNHNKDLQQQAGRTISLVQYIHTGHFAQATFENWESEFLQMALFVVLTIWLKQKGSSESKSFDEAEETDQEPDPARKDAPWPVHKGGWLLAIYKRSLTIALFLLFMACLILHFYGSLKDENEQSVLKGLPIQTAGQYISDSRFWFESFQNWQSEFLSIFAIIVLSIFLRQKGSPQSKPVDAPYSTTGA